MPTFDLRFDGTTFDPSRNSYIERFSIIDEIGTRRQHRLIVDERIIRSVMPALTPENVERFLGTARRVAALVITQSLQETREEIPTEIVLDDEDLSTLREMLGDRECDYQEADGRDLYCSASADRQPAGTLGLRQLAPTSNYICKSCDLPDTDTICSSLRFPSVISDRHNPSRRFVAAAICDLGRPEVASAASCRAGGHSCWSRTIDVPEILLEVLPSTVPLAEAIDFLDSVWRLTFGLPLVRLRSARSVALLIGEDCSSRGDFEARLSAVADLLKLLDVPDALIGREDCSRIPKEHTVSRLRSAIGSRTTAEELAQVEPAFRTLQGINALRNSIQHSGAGGLATAFRGLGIPGYPLGWTEPWRQVRSRLSGALVSICDLVRSIAINSGS